MNRLPITVCIISGAEEQRLSRALESTAAWTSEIIVVLNDDVRDGTEKLALQHGAKVFREPWKGFRAQKNSTAAKATQPWLLGLDADESLTPESHAEIERLLVEGVPPNIAAYSFPRLTWFCGRWIRHGDWYPDRTTRLWRKGSGEWQGADPHPAIAVNGQTAKLSHPLLHHNAETLDKQILKIISFSDDFLRHELSRGSKGGSFDLAFRPCWRFLRSYIFRAGFLDGWQGWYIAWMTAFYTATRYAKLREAHLAGTKPTPSRPSQPPFKAP